MARVVHFEILSPDPERAANFYKAAFGWDANTWGGPQKYWLLTTGPEGERGINGAIMERGFPQQVINTVEVESLEQALARIEKAGGKRLSGPNEIPGVGTHAYCQDLDGTIFGVLQPTPR